MVIKLKTKTNGEQMEDDTYDQVERKVIVRKCQNFGHYVDQVTFVKAMIYSSLKDY